jgi:hypothetical protein
VIACDGCSAGQAPLPADLPGGAGAEREATLVAGAVGASVVRASAAGTDGTDGLPRAAAEVQQPLSVEHPAALAARFLAPPVAPTIGFIVALEVTNPVADPAHGQAAAIGVAPGALTVVEEAGFLAPSEVTCAPVAVGPADLAAGAVAASFRWTCSATRVGAVKLAAAVAGLDGNDGTARAASAVATYVLDEAAEVVGDPFGDGTTFSFVFAYDGHVFLGPSGDGRGVVRCAPDGTGCASFAFTFAYDTTGLVGATQTGISRNVPPLGCAQPVTTLGAGPYCNPDNTLPTACFCGPDFESGRGMFGSFRLGAAQDEWLVAMGRNKKAGELNYAYMTRSTGTPLAFSYVDLYVAMAPEAAIENVVSLAALDDRVYFGLQVENVPGPRVAVLNRLPAPPGLDAVSDADAFAMTFPGTAIAEADTITQVDAMLGFEGRLFVANRRAVIVSRTGTPSAPGGASEFEDCTPTADWAATGIALYPAKLDVIPANKGVTALAAWAGRLYLARNTRAAVPELWVFTPRRDGQTGAFLGCAADRSDWRRIATRFDVATRTHATALFASDRFLYYGLDDATAGVALFRTASPAPQAEADFTGRQGCTAPCTPLGGAGLGDPANRRFFDARALDFGAADQVWATVGDGASAVRVYRIAEQ